MSVRVARLAATDWRLFAGLRLRALSDCLGESDPQYRQEVTFTAANWRRRLRDHSQFAAFVGDRPVGLIGAQQSGGDSVYLYSLWLDPRSRGQGLARPLLTSAVDWARDRRARTVTLRVAADNAKALRVYESMGFRVSPGDTASTRDEIGMTLPIDDLAVSAS